MNPAYHLARLRSNTIKSASLLVPVKVPTSARSQAQRPVQNRWLLVSNSQWLACVFAIIRSLSGRNGSLRSQTRCSNERGVGVRKGASKHSFNKPGVLRTRTYAGDASLLSDGDFGVGLFLLVCPKNLRLGLTREVETISVTMCTLV